MDSSRMSSSSPGFSSILHLIIIILNLSPFSDYLSQALSTSPNIIVQVFFFVLPFLFLIVYSGLVMYYGWEDLDIASQISDPLSQML